jgi:DNA-binding transcriptional LysR family regulator
LAEVRATGRLTLAAERLGLAQPAASRMLVQIERLVGQPVHLRLGRSLRLTEVGEALARRAQRVMQELTDATRDIAAAADGSAGLVRVGSVTGPALSHLMPVLRDLRRDVPGITAEVVVATSDQLCDQVLTGRLDIALGRVPPSLQGQLALTLIGQEPLGLVVRRDHPLLDAGPLKVADLLSYDWVMPEDGTPLAATVMRWLQNTGHPPPRRWVSTSSFLFTLALLKDSDAVAPLARPVVEGLSGGAAMPFVPVPFDMGIAVEAYGLFRRRGTDLPPVPARVARMLLARGTAAGTAPAPVVDRPDRQLS